MLHLGFTDPRWRTLIADWEQRLAIPGVAPPVSR